MSKLFPLYLKAFFSCLFILGSPLSLLPLSHRYISLSPLLSLALASLGCFCLVCLLGIRFSNHVVVWKLKKSRVINSDSFFTWLNELFLGEEHAPRILLPTVFIEKESHWISSEG